MSAPRRLASALGDPRLGWLLLGAGLAVNGWRLLALLNVPGAPDPAQWGLHDFRDALYYPVRALLDGANPYDTPAFLARYPVGQHFPLYAPLTLLVHLPLGLLPYPAALALYGALGLAGLAGLAALALRMNGLPVARGPLLALAGALLLSRPGMMNFLLGQVSLEVVLASLLAWHWRRRRPWAAAVALAFTSIKPTFALPLAVLLAADGHGRLVGRGVALALLGNLPPLLWTVQAAGGPGAFLHDAQVNAAWFARDTAPLRDIARLDAVAVLARLAGRAPGAALTLGVPLVVLGLAAWRLRHGPPLLAGERGALVALAVLLSAYHPSYDALLLAPVALCLVRRALRPGAGAAVRLLAAATALPFVNYAATHAFLWHVAPPAPLRLAITEANGLALAAALFVLLRPALPAPLARPALPRHEP